MWPKYEYVDCNFPRKYLPVIKSAFEQDLVEWGSCSGFCESFLSDFNFAGCKWQILELNEIVTSIYLIEGSIDPEMLTVTILTGKIDNS